MVRPFPSPRDGVMKVHPTFSGPRGEPERTVSSPQRRNDYDPPPPSRSRVDPEVSMDWQTGGVPEVTVLPPPIGPMVTRHHLQDWEEIRRRLWKDRSFSSPWNNNCPRVTSEMKMETTHSTVIVGRLYFQNQGMRQRKLQWDLSDNPMEQYRTSLLSSDPKSEPEAIVLIPISVSEKIPQTDVISSIINFQKTEWSDKERIQKSISLVTKQSRKLQTRVTTKTQQSKKSNFRLYIFRFYYGFLNRSIVKNLGFQGLGRQNKRGGKYRNIYKITSYIFCSYRWIEGPSTDLNKN